VAGIFFAGFFVCVDRVTNSENKGLRYQQNQRARERASETKRTGENEAIASFRKDAIAGSEIPYLRLQSH